MLRSVFKLARVTTKASTQLNASKLAGVQSLRMSSSVQITDQERIDQWVTYFEHPETDNWNIRVAYEEMMKEYCFLEPEVIRASLYAARRINNLPLAIRILELVKKKCKSDADAYLWTMQELTPTLDDLGLKTVEQYGLHQPTED